MQAKSVVQKKEGDKKKYSKHTNREIEAGSESG